MPKISKAQKLINKLRKDKKFFCKCCGKAVDDALDLSLLFDKYVDKETGQEVSGIGICKDCFNAGLAKMKSEITDYLKTYKPENSFFNKIKFNDWKGCKVTFPVKE